MKHQRKGGFLISKIHQLSNRIFSKLLADHEIEINSAQGRILFPLWSEDGISIAELSKKTALGKSTLTSMLDRLEESDHIKRVNSKDDRRKILIFLTEKNKDISEKYLTVSKDMTEIYYENFTSEEINDFEKYLERILSNLQKNMTKE
ncbi:MAG: MarR family transcriptional regulator [Candidatus Heimdallarchaeota archaeon]|nr:MarR family transcriptional regulator [Candidatus Heimdallarchaeota archaeon]MCK4878043.1 MarR family transcriptional regulator [Candidatus Heimdallarchaeota archaeon]